MKRQNKKGFTLIEMMLSIAIIVLISGLFVSLILATKDSYYRTYNSNDSTDYAALYAQALENQILRDWQMMPTINNPVTYGITRDGNSNLAREVGGGFTSPTPIFNLSQMTVERGGTEVPKWKIYIGNVSFNSSTNVLTYTICIVDNYYDPGQLQSTYTSSVWLPMHGNSADNYSSQNVVTITAGNSGEPCPSGLPFTVCELIKMTPGGGTPSST